MKHSRQRVLIALRSFRSVRQAAKSMKCSEYTLMRMALEDDEIKIAYENCLAGVNRQRDLLEEDSAQRIKKEQPLSDEKFKARAEKRKRRFYNFVGGDAAIAVAHLHKRLNDGVRAEKRDQIEQALFSLEALQKEGIKAPAPSAGALLAFDRWCANCKDHRCDNPCEICNRNTIQVKE